MARPRVFISSTFFDLRQIRTDLEKFIRDMGYDPVLHERGGVPYGSKEKLEEYCYREIQQTEILVSIIGGRFGSHSSHSPYSISQQELKTAYELGVQVFIFVEHSVLNEYQTYLKNKAIDGISYNFVDDVGVFRFLEEVHGLPNNNAITGFGTAQDIVSFLREQWAGMFQRFLQQQGRQKEAQLVKDLQSNMQTLNELVKYLSTEKQNSDEAIKEILTSNHPIFSQLQTLLKVAYRVYFKNREELSAWLRSARQYDVVPEDSWDGPGFEEWMKREKDKPTFKLLKISRRAFDIHGDLVVYTAKEWDKEWVTLEERKDDPPSSGGVDEDDVPF